MKNSILLILLAFFYSNLILGQSTTEVNVVKGKKATQSFSDHYLPASKAMDGKKTGSWTRDKDITATKPQNNP